MSAGLIIVTGGAGFIGNNIVRELNRRGITQILIVDELGTDEKWKNLNGIEFEDYADKRVFHKLLASGRIPKAKACFHMGACSSTTETNAQYLMDNNYRYTRFLAQWCVLNGVRMITASSAATYGDGSHGYSDDVSQIAELEPLNMYGLSKHLFDKWALRHGLYDKIAGLKFFNVYGPYEDHKGDMRSVIWKAYHQIKETGKVKLFKSYREEYRDGEQKRDFIYVRDVVDVMMFLFEHPEINGLFNCGTGKARTWLDLAKACFAALDMEPCIEFIDMPETLKEKYQYFTEASMDKLRNAGYDKPFTALEDGAADYIKNYLAKRS